MDDVIEREFERARALLDTVATFEMLREVVLAAARVIGRADGATFVLRDGEHCFYVDEDAIAPLWKGQRFPLGDCITGHAMLEAAVTPVPDVRTDPRIPQAAYRPTFVRSLVALPIGTPEPIGALGVYWQATGTQAPAEALDALIELTGLALAAIERLGLAAAPWAPNFALREPVAAAPERTS